jgi:hypothetical protein
MTIVCCTGVKTNITHMIKKCKMELRKRFPTPALLRAFSFVDPRYYLSEEAPLADFQSKLHLLASHYKLGEPGPGFDQNKLREESPRVFQLAGAISRKLIVACGDVPDAGNDTIRADSENVWDDELVDLKRMQKAEADEEKHPAVCLCRALRTAPNAGTLCSETLRLAKVGMSLIGASVEDERAFSAMTFKKNCLRATCTTNLPLCVSIKLQKEFEYDSFPFWECKS